MSHKANDIVTDAVMETDTTEAWYEQEVEAQERNEDYYDMSYEPSCGGGSPTWESNR